MTIQAAPAGEPAQPERAELIAQAHQRSASYGLRPYESPDFCPVLQSELKTRIERSQSLFTYALPVMETLYDQIVNTQSMVILTDADGLILHSLGDDDFLARADKVALRAGADWSESSRGTNAIGTALAENRATLVHGADHFLEANQFLTCSCMTILDPYGKTVGALDVTGDQRGFHKHTMALVRMSAQMIENQLFGNAFRDMVCIRFHSRAEFLGTLVEGIVSFTPGGRFLSANRSGQFQLGLSNGALQAHTFSSLFGLSMSQLFDVVRAAQAGMVQLQLPSGVKVSARVEWKTGRAAVPGVDEARPDAHDAVMAPQRLRAHPSGPAGPEGLDDLDTGDTQIRAVIGKLRKVIGKDIPVMVLGETGTGKELMARAIHADSPRRAGPFIAVNCASIPENLIESELFGYEEGAFTGARKKGGIGKMLLANGGTLFLDEIGDMPLHLQGRLLRALQERAVQPLGSSKVIHIDVSLVCATNRNLREMVAGGQFREDLYYRLNGMVVRLPALRERSDLDVVAGKLLRQERTAGVPPRIRDSVMEMFRAYHWPGNIRQLGNLLRTARLMAEGEAEITEDHLPDDFLDDLRERQARAATPAAHALASAPPAAQPTRLAEVEVQAIVATVRAHHGNISAAAKALGISRNTVYRKMEEARGLPHQPG
ncbi:sigma-54-dependent Fis family transcriptional regulator [Cupriavidus sp. IK-TO18]|uniref:sigma-54-dependent Fis family transcriptional regulator n=1 Tax=Cupriavidus sp. IK-TO18 TaxID=2782182 RepID=UPI001898F2E7|nr:sigma-54-dependent Fis family transcriptional regulator [Cupriavidus sp. IK-TO18]MBF6991200.1 sigma-54-dependent Fis family transcriptional regulator [Cupriavidus sp. IK-TO18]